jgi:hypothetical protein
MTRPNKKGEGDMPPTVSLPDEVVPSASIQNSEPEAALLAEEVKILRKLAAVQKRWWQDYSLLVAGMAFLLSLATSILSVWTSYQKDIHDQQAQLAKLTQSLQDLSLQQVELPNKYKDLYKDNPLLYQAIANVVQNQSSSVLNNAVSVALRLGDNATTGELVTLGIGTSSMGNLTETLHLFNLAVSAANGAIEKSYALRSLGYAQILFGGSPEMRADGNKTFEKALSLDENYADVSKIPWAGAYLKIAAEEEWAMAWVTLDCAQARTHYAKAQEYLSGVSPNQRTYVIPALTNIGVKFDATGIAAPPGCPETGQVQTSPTGDLVVQPKKTDLP